jgi:hypothetical protein
MQFGRSSRFGSVLADRHSSRQRERRDQLDQPTRLGSMRSSQSLSSGVCSHASSSVLHRSSSAFTADETTAAGSREHALDNVGVRSKYICTPQKTRSPQLRSPREQLQQDSPVLLSQGSPTHRTPPSCPILFRARHPSPPLSLVAPWRSATPPECSNDRPSSHMDPSRAYSRCSSPSQSSFGRQGRRRGGSAGINALIASNAARRDSIASSVSSNRALGAASATSEADQARARSSRPAALSVGRGAPTSAIKGDEVPTHRRAARAVPTPRATPEPSLSRPSASHRACASPALSPSRGGSTAHAEGHATDGYGAGAFPHSSKPSRRKPPRPRPVEHPPEILDLTGGLLRELLLLETMSLPMPLPQQHGYWDGPHQTRASARLASTSRAPPKMGASVAIGMYDEVIVADAQ